MFPSRRNHRTWVPALAVAAVLGLGAGCGGGADAARPTPTTTSSTVPAAMTTTSTSVAPVVPTTRKVTPTSAKRVATTQVAPEVTVSDPEDEEPVDRFSNPGDAAGQLYDAWRADDTAQALEVAAQAVVDDLFSYPVPQDTLTSIGCEPVEVGFACRWAGEQSRLVMIVEGGASAGYRVVWASVHRPPVYDEDGVPQVVVRPERAAVGARVRIDGYGFEGDTFGIRAPSCTWWAVRRGASTTRSPSTA